MATNFTYVIFNRQIMRSLYRTLATAAILFLTAELQHGFAQSVGIAGSAITPDAQSILDIRSTTQGVLLPRMTTAQATTLATSLNAGDAGMTVYDTDLEAYKYWDGTALQWQTIPNNNSLNQNTLDEAYDEGGAGAGRTITADAGAVNIAGADGLTVNGSVGIGTTAPSYQLHVKGAGDALIEDDNAGSAHLRLRSSTGGTATSNWKVKTNAAGTFYIDDDVAGLSRMVIDGNGNVGMDTTAPYYNLNVGGAVAGTILVTREAITANGDVMGALYFDDTDDTTPSTTHLIHLHFR